jgi:hypothetical protein
MTTWHPILAAVELTPGHWQMVDQLGDIYGDIQIVRRGGELGYRADWIKDDHRETVGYYLSLKTSTWHVHAAYLRSHGAPSRRSYGA